ncbi:unnamed protein product [Aphis gossypii]|uniref:Uncharacterized protein n=1 Tax=Aphis gossypii TaxID=80765 RepID=A0A9P0IP23_APHGO|nr:unnamed protein product [Aphis gossypii]
MKIKNAISSRENVSLNTLQHVRLNRMQSVFHFRFVNCAGAYDIAHDLQQRIYLCAEDRLNDEDLLIRSQRASTLLRSLLRRKRIEARLRVTYLYILHYIIIYTSHVYSTPGQGLISTKTRVEVVFVVFFSLCFRART